MAESVTFELLDINGNLIITDNSTIGTLISKSDKVQVLKSKSVKAQEGVLFFNDAIIIGPPGEDILVQVVADSIDKAKIEKSYSSISVVKDVYLMMHMRLCVVGEHQSSDNKCIVCADGFYSLNDN